MNLNAAIFRFHREVLCKLGIHEYHEYQEYQDWSPDGNDIWWYRDCPYCMTRLTLDPIAGKFYDYKKYDGYTKRW